MCCSDLNVLYCFAVVLQWCNMVHTCLNTHGVVRCSVLQCVALCCSVLQGVAVCCSVLQCVAVCCTRVSTHMQLQGLRRALCCSGATWCIQCVAVRRIALQCVAVELQCVAITGSFESIKGYAQY